MPVPPPEIPGEPIPAIGYIRVSMKREEMISPEIQRAAIEDWARRRGRRIVDWIEDIDKTGRNFKRRIMEAIAHVESKQVKEIAVWKYSRFGRNRHGVAVNLARVEGAGGQLQSATEEVDARTAVGKLTRGMLLEIAAFESDRAGEEWAEALQWRRAQGLPVTGLPRFGYDRLGVVKHPNEPYTYLQDASDPEGERYEPNDMTGPALAEMYHGYISGQGSVQITNWLNARGLRNARGFRWTGRTVLDVLDSGFGAGYLRLHSSTCQCGDGMRCKNKEWIRGKHKPVITEETWQKYLERREAMRMLPSRVKHPVYPLSGLVRCAHCKGSMTAATTRGGKHVYYRCARWMRSKDCPGRSVLVSRAAVEDAVKARLREWAADIDAHAALAQSRKQALSAATVDIGRITRDIAANERALVRLAKQLATDEDMPESVYQEARAELMADRARLAAELGEAEKIATAADADPLPIISGVLDEWDFLEPSVLREMLRHLIKEVTVWRGEPARKRPLKIEVVPVWTETL